MTHDLRTIFSGYKENKERLKNLYKKLEDIIDNMPDEEDCADEENEMYLYMVALRNSMENAGYGN